MLYKSVYYFRGSESIHYLLKIDGRLFLSGKKNFWINEARQHRKSVPHFVVGCKADLRHCNLDEFNARCGQLATKVALIYKS